MRIAILGDSHGNQKSVAQALKTLEGKEIACILHCGDIDDAATVALFAGMPTHFVLGNCDLDAGEIAAAAQAIGGHLHGRLAPLELDGKRIAVIHGDDPRQLDEVIHSGCYDYVFHGHTHVAEQQQVGSTLVVNPGALHRARPKTIAILDLTTGVLEFVIVAE